MKYLGIDPEKVKIAVFGFTGCEGCSLQLANKEETLVDFLRALEIMRFREISSDESDEYDIALIDGAITREDEVEHLREIRDRARVLVALGTCAAFGGVNKLKNRLDPDRINAEVYGDQPKETSPARALDEIVPVDLAIPGCPVSKDEVERIVQHLVWKIPFRFPVYPVCLECKQRFTICSFQRGQLCLGPITRGGCEAPCPAGGLSCWGCRGPAADPNHDELLSVAREHGFSEREIAERLEFFGAFEPYEVQS